MKEGQCQLCFVGLIIVCFSSLYFAFKKTLFEMGMYSFTYDKVAATNNVITYELNFTVGPVQWACKHTLNGS